MSCSYAHLVKQAGTRHLLGLYLSTTSPQTSAYLALDHIPDLAPSFFMNQMLSLGDATIRLVGGELWSHLENTGFLPPQYFLSSTFAKQIQLK